MIYKIPKPPKDGYNVLWKGFSKEETSHHKCHLVSAHVVGNFDFRDSGFLYLEQCRGNGEIDKWTLLKGQNHAARGS